MLQVTPALEESLETAAVKDCTPLPLSDAVAGRAEIREVFDTPAQRLESFPGLETTVVSFATDIPSFGGAWGKPLLIGPGSIHAAHTAEEHISKRQLMDAVENYARMTRALISERHKN